MPSLTSADSTNDFDGIAISKLDGDKLAPRNNLTVAFHCDTLAFQPEITDYVGQVDSRFELSRLAVNAEPDHVKGCSELLNKHAITRLDGLARRVDGALKASKILCESPWK